MNLNLLFQLAVSGFLMGGVYSLIALGLSLIFGVMKVINFAHGEMMVWGMYVTYTVFLWTGIDPFFSFLVSAAVLFILGYLLQRTIVNRILDSPEAMQVLPLVGMAMVFENSARIIWGPDYISPQSRFSLSSLSIGNLMIDVPRLLAFSLAIIITIIVLFFLKKTDTGKSIRAAADNRTGALLVGKDINRIYAVCFGVGTACVGVAGGLLVPIMPLSPHIGAPFTMISFIIVILGGMGSLTGAMVGGFIVGIAESIGPELITGLFHGISLGLDFPNTMKQVVSFLILIAILLLKPQGLLGGRR
ncbi:MAG TPA: branched-chain amino acid ABC transporter permease [Thermodesulfobacteriota bacterium]|nr:branched-chain amino acid ABC transporter permease [Thermodesulfobacteriota bacterium]